MDKDTQPETAAGEVTPADGDKTVADCAARFPVTFPADAPHLPNEATDAAIDAWFVETFHNSITSQNTEIFNYCQAAKEDLKRRLAAL